MFYEAIPRYKAGWFQKMKAIRRRLWQSRKFIDDAKDMISSENPKLVGRHRQPGNHKSWEDTGSRKNGKDCGRGKKKRNSDSDCDCCCGCGSCFLISGADAEGSWLCKDPGGETDIYTYDSFVGKRPAVRNSESGTEGSTEVTEADVEKGDKVSAGDVIAKLDTTAVENNIALKGSSAFNHGRKQRVIRQGCPEGV